MTDRPAPPPAAASATRAARAPSFADLWNLADRCRVEREIWAETNRLDIARAEKERNGELADWYRARAALHRRAADQFLAMQRLVARCEQSGVIRNELMRLAAADAAVAAGEESPA
jgi:hypothetical protein